MRKLLSGLCAAALAAATVFTAAAPAAAQTRSQYELGQAGGQYFRGGDRFIDREARRQWRGDRAWRGDRRDFRRGYYHDGRYGWYNGHRGYRSYRPGYREYNGVWFPLAAFAAGAVIGGALNSPEPVYRERRVYRGGGGAHVEWCYNRYRSYRASDNTFQPYNGPRQQCYSPYS